MITNSDLNNIINKIFDEELKLTDFEYHLDEDDFSNQEYGEDIEDGEDTKPEHIDNYINHENKSSIKNFTKQISLIIENNNLYDDLYFNNDKIILLKKIKSLTSEVAKNLINSPDYLDLQDENTINYFKYCLICFNDPLINEVEKIEKFKDIKIINNNLNLLEQNHKIFNLKINKEYLFKSNINNCNDLQYFEDLNLNELYEYNSYLNENNNSLIINYKFIQEIINKEYNVINNNIDADKALDQLNKIKNTSNLNSLNLSFLFINHLIKKNLSTLNIYSKEDSNINDLLKQYFKSDSFTLENILISYDDCCSKVNNKSTIIENHSLFLEQLITLDFKYFNETQQELIFNSFVNNLKYHYNDLSNNNYIYKDKILNTNFFHKLLHFNKKPESFIKLYRLMIMFHSDNEYIKNKVYLFDDINKVNKKYSVDILKNINRLKFDQSFNLSLKKENNNESAEFFLNHSLLYYFYLKNHDISNYDDQTLNEYTTLICNFLEKSHNTDIPSLKNSFINNNKNDDLYHSLTQTDNDIANMFYDCFINLLNKKFNITNSKNTIIDGDEFVKFFYNLHNNITGSFYKQIFTIATIKLVKNNNIDFRNNHPIDLFFKYKKNDDDDHHLSFKNISNLISFIKVINLDENLNNLNSTNYQYNLNGNKISNLNDIIKYAYNRLANYNVYDINYTKEFVSTDLVYTKKILDLFNTQKIDKLNTNTSYNPSNKSILKIISNFFSKKKDTIDINTGDKEANQVYTNYLLHKGKIITEIIPNKILLDTLDNISFHKNTEQTIIDQFNCISTSIKYFLSKKDSLDNNTNMENIINDLFDTIKNNNLAFEKIESISNIDHTSDYSNSIKELNDIFIHSMDLIKNMVDEQKQLLVTDIVSNARKDILIKNKTLSMHK